MRVSAGWLLTVLLLASVPVEAGERALVQDLRREGWDLVVKSGSNRKAADRFREALHHAERIAATDLRVQCIVDLLARFDDELDSRPELRDAMGREAMRLAAGIGRHDLEDRILAYLPSDDPALESARIDTITASRNLRRIEWLWSETEKDSERRRTLEEAMRIIDKWVQAELISRFVFPRNPLPILDDLTARARKMGFQRTALGLLSSAATYDPSRCGAMLEAARALGNDRAIARAMLILDKDLEEALRVARRVRDFPLQLEIIEALEERDPKGPWTSLLAQTKEAYRLGLIDQARRAAERAWFSDTMLVPGLRRFADDPEVIPLLAQLDGPMPAATENSEAYVKALTAALADEDAQGYAALLAEFAGRPEGFGPIAGALKKKANPWTLILALETLATRDVRLQLAPLTNHWSASVRESAAAALLRLGIDGVERLIAIALSSNRNDLSRIYLRAALARTGHPVGFEELARDAASENETRRLHAAGAMAALGFATPIRTLHELADSEVDKRMFGRVMGRVPRTWGSQLVYKASPAAAMRAAALRGDADRSYQSVPSSVVGSIWEMPRSPHEGTMLSYASAGSFDSPEREPPSAGILKAWAARNAGVGMAELGAALESPEADEETPTGKEESPKGPDLLRALADAEHQSREQPFAGGRRDVILLDSDPAGYACCRVRVRARRARLIDNTLKIPFRWTHEVEVRSHGGLAGAFYKSYVMGSAVGHLYQGLDVTIPGHGTLASSVTKRGDGWSILSVVLPREIVGEGLGETRGVSVERLKKARIRFRFDFNGNRGSAVFPVPYVAPPDTEEPDLVPILLSMDPPAPKIGQETEITALVKNTGKTIERGAISSVRFQVKNPQDDQGWRTLDVRVFDGTGWRAGEIRTFRVRPKFVEGYYMNKYSHTWTPAVGDSTLVVVVDPDGAIEEGDEENNRLERPALLDLPEEDARPLAVRELLAVFGPAVTGMRDAQTLEELDRAHAIAWKALEAAKVQSTEIRLVSKHVHAAFKIHEARIRTKKATDRLEKALADGTATRRLLIATRQQIARAERSLLESGVPVKITTIDKVRNVTVTAANLTAAQGEFTAIGNYFGCATAGETPAPLGKMSKAYDGAAVGYRYVKARAEGREADIGDLMDLQSTVVDLTGATVPGMSGLHKAMLKAELEYVDKGMRKNATALDGLARVLAGEEGAEADLRAAAREAGEHAQAGPFTPEALKGMVVGWAKGIPVFGQLVDGITSQK